MLISGKEKLERMRDGRAIYIGAERVDDVTRHAAFRNAARTIADLYEFKADPDRRDLFSFEENGERYGLPWLRCRGVSFWAREPYKRHARHEADYPLSFRFDETDTVLVCDVVKVPWERVFLHNNGAMSRRIYIETPANCYQNHQSNVRFWTKMGLIVGLASRMCQANGVDKISAVRDTLGRLAALEATIGGLVNGQIEAYEPWPEG